MRKTKPFATEADLCAAFLAWLKERHPTLRAYAEWAGWDILVVYPEGFQLGIQAKLRLNAEVLLQAAPSEWGLEDPGPDFRGILVPDRGALSALADYLGFVVLEHRFEHRGRHEFWPPSMDPEPWLDWRPITRLPLPPCETDAVAGSSAPVTLTHWKLCALAVLAELAIKGTITTKRMRELGVSPSRWLQARWLVPADQRAQWARGDRCPAFDEQHPTAYAFALDKARQGATEAASGRAE